eukprot:13141424-Heterocapsa_arctica.AAC.1
MGSSPPWILSRGADIIKIQPPGSESWVLYDHRLEDALSTGYLDAAGPISGMCRMRPSAEDPFGLWIKRKPRNIPWRE